MRSFSGMDSDLKTFATTTSSAAARLLAKKFAPGTRVLASAGPGVIEALAACGLEAVREAQMDAERSVQERYDDPGSPIMRTLPNGHSVIRTAGDPVQAAEPTDGSPL